LSPGDVITICATSIAFHAPARRRREPRTLDATELHATATSELDRALAGGRRLGVLVVQLDNAEPAAIATVTKVLGAALRPIDALAVDGATRVIAIIPEADGDELVARAAVVHAAVRGARTGSAIAPDDASEVSVLFASARDAAAAAKPGEHAGATNAVRQIELGTHRILVCEPAMLRVYALVERIAPSDLPILVLGETGVGKESVVAAIHHQSPRTKGPLVAVNCAALPETLAESTLFGHERGAFSGAVAAQPGKFEAADGGTLFLDEVGELSLPIQAKLLRALDGKSITRLGGSTERTVDVRVVAATNRDLRAEISAGRFREDLYYRLSGALVRVPPLRERPREVPVLARELLAQACGRLHRPVPELGVGALEALARHAWPGNVRELRNAMDFAAAALDGEELETWHLPVEIADLPPEPELPASAAHTPAPSAGHSAPSRFRPIAEELRELERRRMIQALTVAGGVQTRAAELLRMPRRTFVTRMREYDLHVLFPRSL